MPLVRRKPYSFVIPTKEGNLAIDVPYGGAKDPTTPAYWDQLIYTDSYQAALQQLEKLWPEAVEVVPCLIGKRSFQRTKVGQSITTRNTTWKEPREKLLNPSPRRIKNIRDTAQNTNKMHWMICRIKFWMVHD